MLYLLLSGRYNKIEVKKSIYQILVAAFLVSAFMIAATPAKAEEKSSQEKKSGLFIRPSSGLDIKSDTDEVDKASNSSLGHLSVSDSIDISPVLGKPQKKDITNKRRSTEQRALLDITFRF